MKTDTEPVSFDTIRSSRGLIPLPAKEELADLLCWRCGEKTRTKVRARLGFLRGTAPCWLYGRLTHSEAGGWEYTPAQSYPDEIRAIREAIIR